MAHYLSEVTLQKLDSRREDFGPDVNYGNYRPNDAPPGAYSMSDPEAELKSAAEFEDSLGLRHAKDVMGYLRCLAVTSKQESSGNMRRVLWCGEQDGIIVVRDFGTGDPLLNIERKNKVFVFCLVAVGSDFIWAGLSDGYIRVFEGATCALLDEIKAHCGSILDMTYIPSHSHGSHLFERGLVITASNDWNIGLWDTETLQCLGKMSGHQNAVRCLACPLATLGTQLSADADSPRRAQCCREPVLVTGGDDGSLRCWDLSIRKELVYEPRGSQDLSGWPVQVAHRKGVTCVLILPSGYVLSTGQDGNCNVYTLTSGQFVKHLERRPCPIMTMMYDEITDHFWIGGMDGIISIYDGTSMQRTTSLFAHSGAYVVGLKSLSRTNILKVWSVAKEGTVVEAAFGSNLADWVQAHHGAQLAWEERQETQMKEIDSLRRETIKNFEQLEVYRKSLRGMEDGDGYRRQAATVILAEQPALKKDYLNKAQLWLEKLKLKRRQRALSAWLGRNAHGRVQRRALVKWYRWVRIKADARRKEIVAEGLMSNSEQEMKSRYCLMLYEASLRRRSELQSKRAAELLVASTKRGLGHIYFHQWLRYKEYISSVRSRTKVMGMIGNRMGKEMLKEYWERLNDMVKEHNQVQAKLRNIDVLLRTNGRTLLYSYFTTWQRYLESGNVDKTKERTSQLLLERYNPMRMKSVFHAWMSFTVENSRRKFQEEERKAREEAEMWEKVVSGEDPALNPEWQAQERERLEQRRSSREAERDAVEDKIHSMNLEINALQRQLLSQEGGFSLKHMFEEETSHKDRAGALMAILKGKGVNCFYDGDYINNARIKSATALPSAATKGKAPTAGKGTPKGSPTTSTAAKKRPGTPTTPTTPRTFNEKMKNAALHFEDTLRQIQVRLTAAVRAHGFRVKDFVLPEDPLEDVKALDWGIPISYLTGVKGKERREIYGLMKTLVVLWDVTTSESTSFVEDACWAEFVSNSHLFLRMTEEEYTRMQVEGMVAGHEYEKQASGSDIAPQANAPAPSPAPKKKGTRSITPGKTGAPRPSGKAPTPAPRAPTPKMGSRKSSMRSTTGTEAPAPAANIPKPSTRPPSSPKTAEGSRPYMGLKLAGVAVPLTAADRAAGVRTAKSAVKVTDCPEDSPAYKAGLRVGYIVHRFGGIVVTDIPSFNAVASRQVKVGACIPVQYSSGGSDPVIDAMIEVEAKE